MVVYPAIFYKSIEGGYIVYFPDFDGATEGETIKESIEMAQDYIGTYLYDYFINNKEYPKSSLLNEVELKNIDDVIIEESFKTLISLDLEKYIEDSETKIIRKNVSIPNWLNVLGKKNNLNFSNLLKEAIIRELNL